ncbi:hypothetical protein COOONC_23169 [Cooperia oncophora]
MLENSPHLIQRYIFACEGMRVSLGPIKVYNNLVLGSQDALVAGYPRIEDTEKHTFVRYELDYTL